MKNWKAFCLVVLFAAALGTACGKNQKAPVPPTGDEGSPAGAIAAEEVEKTLVDGCDGNGTLAAAKTAFAANDFKEANRQARCAFNDSVKADPNKPNSEAAFFAFLSSLALVVESPQFVYVTDITVAANTVFGTAGDIDSLGNQIEAKFPGSGMAWAKNFFKFHEDKGHSVNDVVAKIAEFFTEHFDDWHVLMKAMATDPTFVNSKIPAQFAGNSSDIVFTFTEASNFLIWVDALRFAGKVLPLYDTGITNSASFADATTLVTDMNTDPKVLSLKGDGNGAFLAPYADLIFTALTLEVGNVHKRPAETWLADNDVLGAVLPKDLDAQVEIAVVASQLKDSLKGGIVFLSASDLKFGIDLKKMFASLPNSASISEAPVKVSGSGVDFREEFLKELIKPFTAIRN